MNIAQVFILILFMLFIGICIWSILIALEAERTVTIEEERKQLFLKGGWSLAGLSILGIGISGFLGLYAVISVGNFSRTL